MSIPGASKPCRTKQIETAIEAIETMLAARAGEAAKVIEGTAEPAALPAPDAQSLEIVLEASPAPKPNDRLNRLMMEADTEVGPSERNPRKGRAPSPSGA